MADVIIPNFTHAYDGEVVMNELFFEPQEGVPSLSSMYRIIDTVSKTTIFIPNSLSKILRKYTTCGWAVAGGTTTMTDKAIEVNKIKANLEECVEAWAGTVWETTMKRGIKINDLSGTAIDGVIKTQIQKGITSDVHRMTWFADENDANADWNQFDGQISLYLDASAAIGAACFIDMDGTSFETGDALAADGAYGLMKQMWSAQDASLRDLPSNEKKFYVTYTVEDNLRDTLEDTQSSLGLLRLIEGGKMFFRGIEIVAVPEWDLSLADTDNPHYTGSGLSIGSNLIVYTTPSNIVIGSDVSALESEFKIRYAEDDDETMKTTYKFRLGTQFIHEKLVCLAY